MKVLNDSLAIKEAVIPMLENDSLIQTSSKGIKTGDTIILEGAYQMQDSTIVSIHN